MRPRVLEGLPIGGGLLGWADEDLRGPRREEVGGSGPESKQVFCSGQGQADNRAAGVFDPLAACKIRGAGGCAQEQAGQAQDMWGVKWQSSSHVGGCSDAGVGLFSRQVHSQPKVSQL